MINLLKMLGISMTFASALMSLNIGDKLNSYKYIEIKSVDKIYTDKDNDIIIENKYVPKGYNGDDRVEGFSTISNRNYDYYCSPYIAGR